MDYFNDDSDFVEAIEEGKIVKVPERYAKREGLPILRKSHAVHSQRESANLPPEKLKALSEQDKKNPLDMLKRKPDWKEKQVISELVDNFSWHIKFERRKKGITRSQLAKIINESENNLKMLEFGIIPSPDFQLINKVQSALGINLRKDGSSLQKIEEIISQTKSDTHLNFKKQKTQITGKDIEILEEE